MIAVRLELMVVLLTNGIIDFLQVKLYKDCDNVVKKQNTYSMEKNEVAKKIAQNAFAESTRGKILSMLELGILVAIFASVVAYLLNSIPNEHAKIDHDNSIVTIMAVIGFVLGAFLFGPSGMCFFSWKWFPVTEKEIARYKESRREEIKESISRKQNRERELNQELKELEI
jgi:hypothetical protein